MSNASNLSTLANVLDDGSDGQFLKSTGSGGVAFDTVAAGAVVYATADLLPLSGNSAGDMAYVTATNRFYINNGSGWYSVSLVNTNPNITSVADAGSNTAPFTLATDGTATVITVTAADPEEVPLTYGYSVTSGSLNGSTVAQGTGSNINVFTVTPHASQDATFTLTFTASDGINQATSANAFSLSFVTIVTDSNHTTLLATATGTGGNSTIEDSSTANSGSGHSITVNGSTYAGTFSPYRSGSYSTYFDGSGDYLQLSSVLPSGAFTVSCWAYFNTSNADAVWSQGTSGNAGRVSVQMLGSSLFFGIGSINVQSSSGSIVPQTWYYIEAQYSGSQIELFINGSSVGTASNTTNPQSTNFHVGTLGSSWDSSYELDGYVSDLKVVSGTPSGSSTVPTEPLSSSGSVLHICHLPYIADGSTNDHSITVTGNVCTKPFSPYDYEEYSATDHGGSVHFDGSNDDLTITDHSAFDLSTGNWTVEFWWNPKSVNTNEGPMSVGYGSGSTPTGLKFAWENDKLYAFSMDGSTLQTGLYHDATAASLVNRWNHVAAVYNGTNTDLYLNGVASGRAQSTNFGENSSDDVRIGSVRRLSSIHYSECSISDVRIVKGTAVYSGNFTPPTGPLTTTGGTYASTTNVNTSITASNTSLLIKGTDASIIDKSQGANLKLIGDTTGSTDLGANSDAYSGSGKYIKFDGSGDYISLDANNDLLDFSYGNGDFTVEGWFYFSSLPTSASNAPKLYIDISSATAYWQLYLLPDGLTLRANNTGIYITESTITWSTNTWYHISLSRSASTYSVHVDGDRVINTTTTHQIGNHAYKTIGGTNLASAQSLNGYIQDFRITRGLARYTAADESSNIPTAPLEG
jgi:hypothetical protein